MSMRQTSRAIIINNKKLLLLTGHGAGYYWTPGGAIEEGETADEALRREMKEELGIHISHYSPYLTYKINYQQVTSYMVDMVDIPDTITVGHEITDFIWYTKGDNIPVSKGLERVMIPRLISEGYL